MKMTHLLYCPWTGLGHYNGFRGNNWLKNRITIFKEFVIPSLQGQHDKDFTLWCSWRPEEKNNSIVIELMNYLDNIKEFKTIHTFHGVCFWDDKYPDDIARDRLLTSLHNSLAELTDVVGEADKVLMTIQPSDDMYANWAFERIKSTFSDETIQAVGFKRGYVINLQTKKIAEWNPKTNPPFFTISFPRATFLDPLKHFDHTGPYKSHEYVGDKLKYVQLEGRGFMVGTHLDNISTVFDHPYTGNTLAYSEYVQRDFCIDRTSPLKVSFSYRKKIFNKFPYQVKRKLRYWAEKKWIFRPLFSFIYNFLRT